MLVGARCFFSPAEIAERTEIVGPLGMTGDMGRLKAEILETSGTSDQGRAEQKLFSKFLFRQTSP